MICECSLWISIASYHFDRKDYNEINPGIILQKERVLGGYYYNSHRRHTMFIAYDYPISYGFSVTLGLATGYKTPLLGAIRWERKNLAIYIAPPTKEQSVVIGFTLKWR
jgi:hypothetical protein